MEILTGDQMRRVDRHVIEELGIPGLDLMESAGRGVAEALLEEYPHATSECVVILCGKGNNGGDGLVAGRHLADRGVRPTMILFARADDLTGDAAANHRAAVDAGLEIEEIVDADAWEKRRALLSGGTIVLDAMLGTGVRGGARGLLKTVIESVNASDARVVSVDLPSGLDGDSSRVPGSAVRAERTYTLCRPKLPLVTGAASAYSRSWKVVPIGIPDRSVETVGATLEWTDRLALDGLLGPRATGSHKGTYGHLLTVAGSCGKAGAAVLVGRGALRSGVGLVTVAVAQSARPEVAAHQAEIMTEPLPEAGPGAIGDAAVPRVLSLLQGKQALALGPGIGTAPETVRAVLAILDDVAAPVVVDADGLNGIAASGADGLATLRSAQHATILTPHPGEAARLLGCSVPDVQEDRIASAGELAKRGGCVVVLKGAGTIVAGPDGRAAVNSTGNPGMATAGTGDVLTGIIGALLARGFDPWDAARLGVFVHGLAGDRAAAIHGHEGLVASDVVDALPGAIMSMVA